MLNTPSKQFNRFETGEKKHRSSRVSVFPTVFFAHSQNHIVKPDEITTPRLQYHQN